MHAKPRPARLRRSAFSDMGRPSSSPATGLSSPPAHLGAQRESREITSHRPGEISEEPKVFLPPRPGRPRGQVGEKVQRHPEDGAENEVPERGRTRKTREAEG